MAAKINMLGDRIKLARSQRNLTQAALAEAAKVPLRTLQDIEYGKNKNPSVDTLWPIARELKVTLEHLIGVGPKDRLIEAMAKQAPPPLTCDEVAQVVKGLVEAGPVRQAAILFFATRDKQYLERLPQEIRRVLPLTDPLK